MKKYYPIFFILLTVFFVGCESQNKKADELTFDSLVESLTADSIITPSPFEWANEWTAGNVISEEKVKSYGIDRCFQADEINDLVFQRINGVSFPESGVIKREDLRYLKVIHYGFDGEIRLGELICNKKIAQDLLKIFKALYISHYPIESIKLIDAYNGDDVASMTSNNTSCFNYRMTSGGSKISRHAYGMAVDINPLYNPYVKKSSGDVLPPEGKKFSDRTSEFPHKIDTNDVAYKEFTKHGFKWGGSWRTIKDYQHFQK